MTLYREIQDELREELVRAVGRNRFRLWFRDAAVADVSEDTLTLAVPTEVHRTWLQFTYGDLLREACDRVLGEGTHIDLRVSAAQDEKRALRDRLPDRPEAWRDLLDRRVPEASLDAFVTKPSGRFPVMLFKRLLQGTGAEDPPSLYLFGECGSGKTHLLKGLRNAAARRSPGSCIYLTMREFTQRYVTALRARDVAALRAFRLDLSTRDLIVLDGLDDLEGRQATQSELVRIQDECLGSTTRLVMAGRRHPRELEGISSKLRSRLLGGVVLRLQVPDRADLEQIVAARARQFDVELPNDVSDALLTRTASVRGAVQLLDRWAAASAEVGQPLDPSWLDELAPGVTATASEEVIRRAKDLVANHYGIQRRLLDRPTKVRSAALPRRIAMYLVYRACAMPLVQLGKAFGLRSHSSVSRAIREVRALRQTDAGIEQTIDGLLARI